MNRSDHRKATKLVRNAGKVHSNSIGLMGIAERCMVTRFFCEGVHQKVHALHPRGLCVARFVEFLGHLPRALPGAVPGAVPGAGPGRPRWVALQKLSTFLGDC